MRVRARCEVRACRCATYVAGATFRNGTVATGLSQRGPHVVGSVVLREIVNVLTNPAALRGRAPESPAGPSPANASAPALGNAGAEWVDPAWGLRSTGGPDGDQDPRSYDSTTRARSVGGREAWPRG